MFVLANMWFQTLMRTFFFNIDKLVYNFISMLYEILINIARTSILSQADLAIVANRLYDLLAVFMVFKVTFSLIMYVVNPDDFSDKSKGVAKLGTNIIISLSLLILTPYIFRYAYQLQTIILEDNSLSALIFGDDKSNYDTFNNAGDTMAYMTMLPFFAPNLGITKAYECAQLTTNEIREGGRKVFNESCSGLKLENDEWVATGDEESLYALAQESDGRFSINSLKNYVTGVEIGNFPLMFRLDMATATDKDNENYIIEYRYIFSTIVGVIIVLLLISFCMDVALRSIKLAALQLVAPIPIISYVDPKSGKDGLFKKWYQMCFKTYLSLFIRLLALYFAVFIIARVDRMSDIITGAYVNSLIIKIFIIIGALMFAKQLPKLLEGLGIKLDGGDFQLNPLKKFEDQALGGKRITGMARGAISGTVGMATGAGLAAGLSGAWRGLTDGKGWKEAGKSTAEMNRRMRQAKMDGSTFLGRMGTRVNNAVGAPTVAERYDSKIHKIDEQIKDLDNKMAPSKKMSQEKKLYTDAVSAMEKRAIEKIEQGEAGSLSVEYRKRLAHIESLKSQLDSVAREGGDTTAIEQSIAKAENESRKYLNDEAMRKYINANMSGDAATRTDIFGKADGGDATLTSMTKKMESIVDTYGDHHTYMKKGTAEDLHDNLGRTKGEITNIEIENEKFEREKRNLSEEKQQLYEKQRTAKADENAVK